MIKIKRAKTLSAQIAWVMGFALCVVFAILISITYFMTKNAIEESSFAELEGISKNSSLQVQQVITQAESMSQELATYMEDSMINQQKVQNLLINPGAEAQLYHSQIYPEAVFKNFGLNIENYYMNTLSTAVTRTEEIVGAGVLYQPFIMSAAVESYSLYADANGNIKSFGDFADYSQQAYYKDAVAAGKIIFSAPYEYEGITMITAATPINVNVCIGVVVVDIALEKFNKTNVSNTQYPSMYSYIIRGDGTVIYDSVGLSFVGKNKIEALPIAEDKTETKDGIATGQPFVTVVRDVSGAMVYEFYNPISAGDETWFAVTNVKVSDVNSAAKQTGFFLTLFSGVALILLLILIIAILRRQLQPINEMVCAAESIAEGNLDITIDIHREDEIGQLAAAFRNTIHALQLMIQEITYVLEAISNNDLNIHIEMNCKGEFVKMEGAAKRIIDDLNDIVGEISRAADQVAMGSEQVSLGAQSLSQGSTEQAGSIQELAAALIEITQKINRNALDAKNASDRVNQVSTALTESDQQMQNMMSAMVEIRQSSEKISNIIKTIEDIAFQTNILALNAAVEAARAGAAGKGFAVVADEVRNLASKSAEAVKDTTSLIEASMHSVANGVQIANDTAKSITDIVDGATKVTTLIDRISEVSNQQADNINQIKVGIDQVSSVVQNNSATAEESAAASEELSSQAQLLKSTTSKFQLKEHDIIQ